MTDPLRRDVDDSHTPSSGKPATKIFAALLGIAALLLPPYFLLHAERRRADSEPQRTINGYYKAAYAHDFAKAYSFISAQDRSYKTERAYVREKGPFSGFTLDVARKLAELIEMRSVTAVPDGPRLSMKFNVRLPDANDLSPLLLDWDEDKLNALPKRAQLKLLGEIEKRHRTGELKMIQGEEEFVAVKEGSYWRVLLDWASGLAITFDAAVPPASALEASPLTKQTVVRPQDLFMVAYRVKNRSGQPLTTRIVHRIQPAELKQHLDIVECALLLPVKLSPGQQADFSTTYIVRGDLPDAAKRVVITYDFQVEP